VSSKEQVVELVFDEYANMYVVVDQELRVHGVYDDCGNICYFEHNDHQNSIDVYS
jgi:hypothetical protein